MANDCIPYKYPADDFTFQATAPVVGKTFVKISAARTSGPGLSNTAEGSVYRCATAAAGQQAIGVAKYDAPTNGKCGAYRAGIVPVTAGATITAGQPVMANATGQAIPWVSAASEANAKLGVAMNDAANGADAEIALMLG